MILGQVPSASVRRTSCKTTSQGSGGRGLAAVILAVIPQATTKPDQTALARIPARPDLARPYWTVENKISAVIS
jgi:hypothetical protein